MAKSNYAVDVKTLFDQGKNTKAKVLDDLTDKLAAHTKLANQFMENSTHILFFFLVFRFLYCVYISIKKVLC